MLWEEEQVRRCTIGTTAVGLLGAVLLCVSFATTHWMVLPPGHYYITTHTVYMGLWTDQACYNDQCGPIPPTALRQNTNQDWNMVLGLMCTTISVVFIGASLNIVILVSPRKIFTVLAGLFWILAGVANMLSVITFSHQFKSYAAFASWSYWISMISTIIFYAVGLTMSIFACCHRWVTRATRSGPEDPVAVAPPPVVSYKSDATTADGKAYDFNTDPDMQPYDFGGQAYESNRSNRSRGKGNAQSYNI